MQTAQIFNSQFEYDSATDENPAADSLETECQIFAERFTENQMDAPTFFELAEAFGSETIGDYLGDDDQHNLLQLILAAHSKPSLKMHTTPIINRLYTAAYKHKEGELK